MKLLLFSLFSVFLGDPRRSFNKYAANSWQIYARGFPGDSVVKNPSDNPGDSGNVGSVPGVGRSPGEGNGKPLPYSRWENPMDRGAWWATVHGVGKLDTTERLDTHTPTQLLSTLRISSAFSSVSSVLPSSNSTFSNPSLWPTAHQNSKSVSTLWICTTCWCLLSLWRHRYRMCYISWNWFLLANLKQTLVQFSTFKDSN